MNRSELTSGTGPLPTAAGSASAIVLSVVFACTGVGTAALGAVLPTILRHWSLNDRQGGMLFLWVLLGSSLGAVLSRGDARRSLTWGLFFLAAACAALLKAPFTLLFPVAFVYGTGLGMTMTSISLLRSERTRVTRSQEMNRLNMLWAVGALSCPLAARHTLETGNLRPLLLGGAMVFGAFWVWACLVELRLAGLGHSVDEGAGSVQARLPWLLGVVSALVIGVESSLGGWLTTYVQRNDHSIGGAVRATACFWVGLLLSRALYAMPGMGRLQPARILEWHLVLTAVSAALLCAARAPLVLAGAAAFAGFGLGPLFPTLLALVLPRYRGTRVFLLGGLGSAVFPWLTGWLSAHTGSLRLGLLAPVGAAGVLLILLWPTLRILRRPLPVERRLS